SGYFRAAPIVPLSRGLGASTKPGAIQSGELQGRSSVWLPAWLPSASHHHALVLVTTIGPLRGPVTAPCPAQAPPPNPIAAAFGGGHPSSACIPAASTAISSLSA